MYLRSPRTAEERCREQRAPLRAPLFTRVTDWLVFAQEAAQRVAKALGGYLRGKPFLAEQAAGIQRPSSSTGESFHIGCNDGARCGARDGDRNTVLQRTTHQATGRAPDHRNRRSGCAGYAALQLGDDMEVQCFRRRDGAVSGCRTKTGDSEQDVLRLDSAAGFTQVETENLDHGARAWLRADERSCGSHLR